MREIESLSQLNKALSQNDYTVVDMGAKWCLPCSKLKPYLKMLDKEYTNVVFLYVDIDESDDIVREYDVKSIPYILFFKGTSLQKNLTVSGAQNDQVLRSLKTLVAAKKKPVDSDSESD